MKDTKVSTEIPILESTQVNTQVHKRVLENGVTVLVDSIPHARTVAFAVSLLGGSRDETRDNIGLTHLLEHLLFKRTNSRSTRQIAELMDELGGSINALTDTEWMCLYGAVPVARLGQLVDFFSELLFENAFTEEDLALEKEVIRQEILEAEDSPIEAVLQTFYQGFWPHSQLGLPVFGFLESLEGFDMAAVRERLQELLKGKRVMIGVAGPVTLDEVLPMVSAKFSHLEPGERPTFAAPTSGVGLELVVRPVGQCYVALGQAWTSLLDADYLAGVVLTTIFGDGMSSRLFQLLREDKGLAYDIRAQSESHTDSGLLIITSAVERRNLEITLSLIASELERLRLQPPSQSEISRAVRMLTAQLEMENDLIDSRLWRALETELTFGRYIGSGEIITTLNSIGAQDIASLIERRLRISGNLLVLGGAVEGFKISEQLEGLFNPLN